VSSLPASDDDTSTYRAEAGQACTFDLRIGKAKPSGKSPPDFAFVPAILERVTNADCAAFLGALAPTLGFKGRLPTPIATKRLSLTVAILGANLSRNSDRPEAAGGFSSQPPGHWTATKLFLRDGEGEVFLSLNLQDGLGEFSIKDEDYAEIVVTELARIMLPQ